MADATTTGSDRLRALPALTPRWARRWHGFPQLLTPLIGREQEVAALADLLRQAESRLTTVTGPGGVGKTRLAIAAATACANDFRDGAVFVPLAAIREPALVLPAIAQALELRASDHRPLDAMVVSALRERQLLLVLDNFEHVTDAAPVIANLVAACPMLTVLVTSRARLRLNAERRFVTPPLALPTLDGGATLDALADTGAIALFVERAQATQSSFALSARNAEVISAICRRLDGLPLAIVLAATWVRVVPPAVLLQRLEHGLSLLQGGAADQPARLRTLRDAIAWSYDLLTENEARLLRRLATFAGGFTLDAVEAISQDDSTSVLDLLAALIDKSLLHVQSDGVDTRFVLLETVREFALERLVEAGEALEVAAAHAGYVLALCEQAAPELLGPHEWRWMARLDAELGNLRVALTWALEQDVEMALRMAAALWPYWGWHQPAEGRRWLTSALAHPAPTSALVRAKALNVRAALAVLEADAVTGIESGLTAASLAQDAGDAVAEAAARWLAGYGYLFTDDITPAVRELDRSLELFARATTSTDRTWEANATWARGAVALVLGERAQGISFYERALAQAREAGSDLMTLLILSDFAGWLFDLGERERARAMLHESLALAMDRAGFWFVSYPLIGLALVEAVEGESVTAAGSLGTVETLLTLSGLVVPPAFLQERFARATTLTKRALGEDAFAAAWKAGRADLHGIIAKALGNAVRAEAPRADGRMSDIRLSARQREVLALIAAGHSDQQVAEKLFISRRTASHHVTAIMTKLNVRSRGEAAVYGIRAGLI